MLTRFLPFLLVLAIVPSAAGGNYFPPPGDFRPVWSPDGSRIAFATSRGGVGIASVRPDGSEEARVHVGHGAALSPDWKRLAELRDLDQELMVDGKPIARGVTQFAWAPTSERLVFSGAGELFVIDADGTDQRRIADHASSGVWSPAGDLVAFQKRERDRLDIHVVAPDGTGERNLTPEDDRRSVRPIWSPDGRSLAYVKDGFNGVYIVDLGEGSRAVPLRNWIPNGEVAWFPDGRGIAVETSAGLVVVDLATGRVRKWLPFATGLVWSRDGTRLAFSNGGECRDRSGIYVAEGDGTGVRRITNDCRIIGTEGPDRLVGTAFADVLVGLGGNDTLRADASYMGDTLEGGAGKDVLTGDMQKDTLDGGTGADVLRGGPSGDLLLGGAGRDVIYGQGGIDVIQARDGWRDRLSCGTNRDNTRPELDTVYADRFDHVSRDCEVVRRR